MLRDQWTAAFRSLANSKFHSAMNVAGLAIGFAAALLLGLYVHDEVTFDHALPAGANRISSTITLPGGRTVVFDGTDYSLAAGMRLDLPQVDAVARMMPQDWTVRHDETEANETVYWSDSALFSVLPVPAVAGDPASALNAPNALVLTRSAARKYFGTDAAVGKTLTLNRRHLMRVAAVIEDFAPNTHIAARIFGSGSTPFGSLAEADARQDSFHFDGTTFTYFRLKPGATLDSIRPALPDLVVERLHIPKENPFGVAVDLSVLPVRDIHFAPAGVNAMKAPGDKATVWAAAIVALLIVAGACVNFVNLTTARVSRRTLEVGVRKALGAGRGALAGQFILEAVIQVAAGMILAIAIAELVLPAFREFLERDVAFAYWDWRMAGSLVLAVAAVVMLAGAYPALLLSSLPPAVAVRGGPGFLNRGGLRRVLVVLQFAILTGLVISTAVIWRQTRFAEQSAARLADRNTILVTAPCTDAIKAGLTGLADVTGVACSEPAMITPDKTMELLQLPGSSIHSFQTLSADPDFLRLYGMRPIAGRLLDTAFGGDVVAPPAGDAPQLIPIVVNRTGARTLGASDPKAALGLRLQSATAAGKRFFTVVGVVPDMPSESVRVPIGPVAYFADPAHYGMISAQVRPGRTAAVAAQIGQVWMTTGQPGLPKTLPLSLYAASLVRDILREGILFAAAAGVSLLIACIGLFGMASFMAEQRTKEIGIRKAMGATTRQVATLLLRQFLTPVLWANLIAWPITWWLMRRWLAEFAYHVPLSLWVFVAGGLLTLAVTVVTVLGHALLVARRPPVTALRYE